MYRQFAAYRLLELNERRKNAAKEQVTRQATPNRKMGTRPNRDLFEV